MTDQPPTDEATEDEAVLVHQPLDADTAPLARQPHRGSAPQFDWPTIKRRYVEGVKTDDGIKWETLEEVAQWSGASHNRVRERSAAEGWRAERTRWQQQVENTRRQARAAALAKSGVDLDNKALDSAKIGLTLCKAALEDVSKGTRSFDAVEQTRLAQAVDLWHKIGLRAIGDPETHRVELTGANGQPIEIAAELRRDDPTRITNVLAVLDTAGIGRIFGGAEDARRSLENYGGGDGLPPASGAGG